MSDSNRIQLAFVEESVWGTTPASALQILRHTGESLNFEIESMVSAEVRSDRMTADLIQIGAKANGGFNIEFSFGTYDTLIEGALWSGWETAVDVSSVVIAADDSTNAYTSATLDLTTINLAVGQWIKVAGFTEAGNNGVCKVESIASGAVVVSGLTLTDEAAGDTITMEGIMIRNDVTEHSYSIEKKHADVTQFFGYTGMVVTEFGLKVAANAAVTGDFGFEGKAVTLGQVTIGSGSPTATTSTDVFNSLSNVGTIKEGGSALSLFIQEISFKIANNVRGIPAVGVLGSADIGVGKLDLTGTLNVMFAGDTLYDKYIANTATSLSFRLTDSAGNIYIFTIPRIKFETDTANGEGQDSDVVETISWRAIRDPTTNCMIQIDKIAV